MIDTLLKSREPSIHWKVGVKVLGEDPNSRAMKRLQNEIRSSPRVRTLLATRDAPVRNIYAKWQGAHWVLAMLADLGYPPGDENLFPLRDRVLQYWLSDFFYKEFDAENTADAYKKDGVPRMNGRYRRCASQQGNALLFLTQLQVIDGRKRNLVERLLHWQWPDGGWNCDKNPGAQTSSFMETMLPMRGLALHARDNNDAAAKKAALKAADVFLSRNLFKRCTNGAVMHPEFLKLHFPLYWHYDVLGGLKAMADLNLIKDSRCSAALDLLEGKALKGQGWPAEARYYTVSPKITLNADFVDWGGTSKAKMNEWVTADALAVLSAAGRVKGSPS